MILPSAFVADRKFALTVCFFVLFFCTADIQPCSSQNLQRRVRRIVSSPLLLDFVTRKCARKKKIVAAPPDGRVPRRLASSERRAPPAGPCSYTSAAATTGFFSFVTFSTKRASVSVKWHKILKKKKKSKGRKADGWCRQECFRCYLQEDLHRRVAKRRNPTPDPLANWH